MVSRLACHCEDLEVPDRYLLGLGLQSSCSRHARSGSLSCESRSHLVLTLLLRLRSFECTENQGRLLSGAAQYRHGSSARSPGQGCRYLGGPRLGLRCRESNLSSKMNISLPWLTPTPGMEFRRALPGEGDSSSRSRSARCNDRKRPR